MTGSRSLDSLELAVHDFPLVIDWYTQCLGLQIVEDNRDTARNSRNVRVVLKEESSGFRLQLVAANGPQRPTGSHTGVTFTLEIGDIELCVSRLRATDAPVFEQSGRKGTWEVSTDDPLGHHWRLIGYKLSDEERALPFFVYGTLKHDQLGFRQIQEFVDHHEPATLHGWAINVRDGLPGIRVNADFSVQGDLLYATQANALSLRSRIMQFEPTGSKGLYELRNDVTVEGVQSKAIRAQTHIFLPGGLKEKDVWGETWSLADDPLFRFGFPEVLRRIHASPDVASQVQDSNEGRFWKNYIPALGDFLTLTGVLERCTTLMFGPRGIMKNITSFGELPEALEAAMQVPMPTRTEVLDSRNLKVVKWTPRTAWTFWYQVRSNAVHRGKSAERDAELIAESARGLSVALHHFLGIHVIGLQEKWAMVKPDEKTPAQIADDLISSLTRN